MNELLEAHFHYAPLATKSSIEKIRLQIDAEVRAQADIKRQQKEEDKELFKLKTVDYQTGKMKVFNVGGSFTTIQDICEKVADEITELRERSSELQQKLVIVERSIEEVDEKIANYLKDTSIRYQKDRNKAATPLKKQKSDITKEKKRLGNLIETLNRTADEMEKKWTM